MKEETRITFTHYIIEEYYSKENGRVYWFWRFQNQEWRKELTPFNDLPWTEFNRHAV